MAVDDRQNQQQQPLSNRTTGVGRRAFLRGAALTDGALSRKVKELMAFAIGIVQRCDGCIASHAQAATRAGATREEAAEAIGVAILMHGGPATIYGARAYTALCEFADAEPS